MNYIYRAMNSCDNDKFKNQQNILAQCTQIKTDLLENAAMHIKNGSTSNSSDCWISCAKDFWMLLKEYAIPQCGNFNTADTRKNVAVIDFSYWKSFQKNDPIKNHTIFKNEKNIIEDFSKYTYVAPQPGKKRMINNKIWTYQKLLNKIRNIRNNIINNANNQLPNIAALDCGFSHLNPPRVPLIQELTFFQMCWNNNSGTKAYHTKLINAACNSVEGASPRTVGEVLILKEIPYNCIAVVISPELQDILYRIPDETILHTIFNAIKQNNLYIYIDKINNHASISYNNIITNVPLQNADYLGAFFDTYIVQGINLSDYYATKRQDTENILNQLSSMMSFSINTYNNLLEEDGAIYHNFDINPICTLKSKSQLYDLVAITYNQTLYTSSDKKKLNKEIENLQRNNQIII